MWAAVRSFTSTLTRHSPQAPMAAGGSFNAAEFFGSERFADMSIVLRVGAADGNADTEPAAKRQRCTEQDAPETAPVVEELPGHSMVLAGFSPVFKAQLMRWQDEQSSRPRITLCVDSQAELEAARALVRFIYEQCLPDGAEQPLLVTLLRLADRFQVETCIAACAAALGTQELTAETVDQVLRLPPVHLESPLFSGVLEQVADKLQQGFSDLDVLLESDEMTERFMRLPLKGIELLLGDRRTRVMYGNTAVRAATWWLKNQKDGVSGADTKRLAQLIRIPNLTPMFGSSVALLAPWIVEGLGASTVSNAHGIMLVLRGSDAPGLQDLMCRAGDYGWPASWALGARPGSARKEAVLEWRVSLKELEAVFAGDAGEDGTPVSIESENVSFGGYRWYMFIDRKCDPDSAGATLGMYLIAFVSWADKLPDTTCVPVMVALGSISCLHPDQQPPLVMDFNTDWGPLDANNSIGVGTDDFWFTGAMADWDAARFAPWADSNGQLTLLLKVADIL